MSTLNTATAKKMLQRAEHRASELKVNACISIVDTGGYLISFQRMDGVSLGPIDVSQRKARASALFNCDSGDFGKIITEQSLIGMENSNGGLATFPGGIPIHDDDQLIGAIGVSGGSAKQDHIIAHYALDLKT